MSLLWKFHVSKNDYRRQSLCLRQTKPWWQLRRLCWMLPLIVQIQQWKHQNNKWILFNLNNKGTRTTSFWCLYCQLRTFHKSCYHCWIWTSKCRLDIAKSQVDNVIFLDGQGFLREHRSYIVKGNQNDTEYATDLLDVNKDNTTLDFMLVSSY